MTAAATPSLETRAASATQRVLAQARFESLAILRNGEQLLVSSPSRQWCCSGSP